MNIELNFVLFKFFYEYIKNNHYNNDVCKKIIEEKNLIKKSKILLSFF